MTQKVRTPEQRKAGADMKKAEHLYNTHKNLFRAALRSGNKRLIDDAHERLNVMGEMRNDAYRRLAATFRPET